MFWIDPDAISKLRLSSCSYDVIPDPDSKGRKGQSFSSSSNLNSSFSVALSSTLTKSNNFEPAHIMNVEADFVKVTCFKDWMGFKSEAFINFVALAYRNPETAREKMKIRYSRSRLDLR